MIRWLLPILLLSSLLSCGDPSDYDAWLVTQAQAADKYCGVDTDQNGTIDNMCPEPDKDGDSYPSSSAYTGPYGTDVDCDDNDYWMHTGVTTTTGCSGGQFKTCQADGTFTACAAISTYSCNTAAGATYWVDDAETDCTGDGSHGDPESWKCWTDTGMSGYHAPGDGDCIVFQCGTSYSGTWSDSGTTRQFRLNNKDGTSGDPIKIRNEPGCRPTFNGAGTPGGTQVQMFEFTDSNYIDMAGLKLDGTSDYSNAGVWVAGGTLPHIHDMIIQKIDGNEDNNVAGVKCSNGTVGCWAHHILLADNYETGGAGATQQNNWAIVVFDDTGTVKLEDNVVANTTSVGAGIGIKHGNDSCTPYIRRNKINSIEIGAIRSENKDTTATNNWIQDCAGYALYYGGIGSTAGWFKDSVFSYNTIERCAFLNAAVDWSDSTGHTSYSGTTIFTAQGNIVADDNASYDSDNGDGVTRICQSNCTSGEYAASAGKAIWLGNVYYSSGTSTLHFGYFGDAGGGANYTSLASWQGAGYDSGSVQANPSLDSDGISATYPNHGWRAGIFTALPGTAQGAGGSARKPRSLR